VNYEYPVFVCHTVRLVNQVSRLTAAVTHAQCELAGFECNTADVISYFSN